MAQMKNSSFSRLGIQKKKEKKEGIFILILPKIIHILLYMLTLLIDTVKKTNFIYCYVVLCFVPVGSVHVRDCLSIFLYYYYY